MSSLNQRWEQRNKMHKARDRHHNPENLQRVVNDRMTGRDVMQGLRDAKTHVGSVRIVPGSGNVIPISAALVRPMNPSMVQPLVRRMGETTISNRTRRAQFGSENLWKGTPIEEERESLGSPELLQDAEDITGLLGDWDRVGWVWSHKDNTLTAFLTLADKTYLVRLPLAKIQAIFGRVHRAHGEAVQPYREQTLGGFFKKIGRGLKKAVKGIVKNTIKSITAPIRFFKNPKKFVKDTAAHIKKTVKGVGKTVLKVASSPIFAGVMTALAAIPPLTVVGAAGLAAFAAANAIKPAFKLAEKGIDTVDAIARRKKIKANINSLPPGAKGMMNAALKSTPVASVSKSAFRFAGGALQKIL